MVFLIFLTVYFPFPKPMMCITIYLMIH